MKYFKLVVTIAFCLLLLCPSGLYASWDGPHVAVLGSWGSNSDEFGLKKGDTISYDIYPVSIKIFPWGWIFIADDQNKRTAIYKTDGTFIENVAWNKIVTPEYEEYERVKYTYNGEINGFGASNTFWTKDQGTYRKYDSSFNLIQTSPARPLELGKITKTGSGTQWHYEIDYPDGIYVYDGAKDMLSEKGIIRINANLIMQNLGEKVYAFKVVEEIPVPEGEKKKYKTDKVAEWVKPKSSSTGAEPIVKPDGTILGYRRPTSYNIYGDAVIGPDGSIYTWMRSETNYKILRWRWVEQ